MNEHRLRIGASIRAARESKGWSIRELAEMSGVTYSNLCNIENGRYSVGIDVLQKIGDQLGLQVTLEERG